MHDQSPIRTCATFQDAGEEPQQWSLWEPDPHYQVDLIAFVAMTNAEDRALPSWDPHEDTPMDSLVWRDFPSRAAVEAANAALHETRYFDELEEYLERDCRPPSLGTVAQRLRDQRYWHSPAGLAELHARRRSRCAGDQDD
jgi:hypothetical protein